MISIPKNASIVVLTGAGISAESGIQTFRGGDGLWCGHRIEDVATPEAFIRNPSLVHDFYNMRRAQLLSPDIKPNAAHLALAELEARWQGNVHIVTQNIDDLHSRAGSKNLIHMHGELLRMFCTSCGKKTQLPKISPKTTRAVFVTRRRRSGRILSGLEKYHTRWTVLMICL